MHLIRHHFSSISSTNSWAKMHSHLFDPQTLILISADKQTSGRGQFSRKWHSPPGKNITISLCFFLEQYPKDIETLSLFMAQSTVDVLLNWGLQLQIKPPNDLMVNGKKMGGCLIETTPTEEGLFVVAGLGLNVNMTAEELKLIDQPATSLVQELGYPLDRNTILHELLVVLCQKMYQQNKLIG